MVLLAASGENSVAESSGSDGAGLNWSRSCGARLAWRTRTGRSPGSPWTGGTAGPDTGGRKDPPLPPVTGVCAAGRLVGSTGRSPSGQDPARGPGLGRAVDQALTSSNGWEVRSGPGGAVDQALTSWNGCAVPVGLGELGELGGAMDHALVSWNGWEVRSGLGGVVDHALASWNGWDVPVGLGGVVDHGLASWNGWDVPVGLGGVVDHGLASWNGREVDPELGCTAVTGLAS